MLAEPLVVRELESLLRILRAEERDGARDRVIAGGVGRYAQRVMASLSGASLDAPVAEALQRLTAYSESNTEGRCGALSLARETIERGRRPLAVRAQPTGILGAVEPARWITVPDNALSETATPGVPRSLPVAASLQPGIGLNTPISELKGVGQVRARLYERLGIVHVEDLLSNLPLRHIAYPPARPIRELFFQSRGSVVGTLERLDIDPLSGGLRRMRALVSDETGQVVAVWLRHGKPHLSIRPGELIALSGNLSQVGRQLAFDNPDFEPGSYPPLHTRGLVPVYGLTTGLTDKELRNRIRWAVTHFAAAVSDSLPDATRDAQQLLGRAQAVRAVHFPSSLDDYERARRRFAFEELFLIQLLLLRRRATWQSGQAVGFPRAESALAAARRGLPFELTAAQERVLEEVLQDTTAARPMTRLVQGDVGSGKTIVAALALLNAVAGGRQGALMAPTEILAEQHFATLRAVIEGNATELEATLGAIPVLKLLTGRVKGRERQSVYEGVAEGSVDILVGTQALIQETLEFARLGIIVVDEQHRFGVKQRVTLRQRAQHREETPHLLVMTATPIPRTLQLTLHGDLDLSRIDQMPAGRQPVETLLFGGHQRSEAYEYVRGAVSAGRQAFVVCPLVEESDLLEARAATAVFETLRKNELTGLRLRLLHGRMKSSEKEAIMRAFREGEADVLVATAVVEVGVDVPNATVMVIEGAERFGLAQLHQFRGRVGRGKHTSTCVLISDLPYPEGNERLRALLASTDGLELAERDLQLRGPGDYFGVRQSGFVPLRAARLSDVDLVHAGRAEAESVLGRDPELSDPANGALAARLHTFAEQAGEPS